MTDKRKQIPSKTDAREKPADLARSPVKTLVARTEGEWRRFIDTVVDEVKRALEARFGMRR